MRFTAIQKLLPLLTFIIMACNEPPKSDSSKQIEGIIQENLIQMSKYAMKKESDSILGMFDESDEILLVGSDSSEVRHGKKEIGKLIKEVMAKPYLIHWDFSGSSIYTTENVAWAFSNKTIVLEDDKGGKITSPYRLTSVWVKRGSKWKLKLFNGSVPGRG